MNVTEKQKQILVNFMQSHPDFGRGRMRYNRENKKRLDELWEEITTSLNSAGLGPQKSPKEWAKTWRDWKSNLLKRVAICKSYAGGTGGGPPKTLDTSLSEENLLEFLTPEASGMSGIPEGGAIGNNNDKSSTLKSLQTWNTPSFRGPRDEARSSWQSNVEKLYPLSDVIDAENLPINAENLPINNNKSLNVLASIENSIEETPKSKRRYSDDRDTDNKKVKRHDVKHLLGQYTSDYSHFQQRLLQLKEEKIALIKEKFEFKKNAHHEHIELLTSLIDKVDELTNVIPFAPQYLE